MPDGLVRTALGLHRLARLLHRLHLRRAARAVTLLARVVTKVQLDPTAVVARDVVVSNGHGLVVGPRVEVGPGCVLHQGVTLMATAAGAPRLGAGVVVEPGASVLGPVTLGDGARVGPRALVLHDVAPGACADGVAVSTREHWTRRPA